MKEMLETKTGTVNLNGFGTAHWIEPGQPMMEAIFGQKLKKWDPMLEWCMETFDKTQWDISQGHVNRILFKKQADRTAFMLKWC
jgi:hypothetical protein